MKSEITNEHLKMSNDDLENQSANEEFLSKKYTIKGKIDVLRIIKGMSNEQQEELIDWIIKKINEKSSIIITDSFLESKFKDVSKITQTKDNVVINSKVPIILGTYKKED